MVDGTSLTAGRHAAERRKACGPEAERVDRLVNDLRSGSIPRSVHFQGGRYTGKSSLAALTEAAVWAADGIVARIDLDPQIDLLPRICHAIEDLLRELDTLEPVTPLPEVVLEHLLLSRAPIRVVHPRVVVPSDGAGAARDIVMLLDLVGRAAKERGTFVVIVIDDVHRADRPGGRALFDAIAHLRGVGLPVAFAIFGLPSLPRLSATCAPVHRPDVDVVSVSDLSRDDAEALLSGVLEEADPEAIAAAIGWIDGSRLRASVLGRVLGASGGGAVSVAEVDRALLRAGAVINRSVYERAIEALNAKELRLLAAMVQLDEEVVGWDRLDKAASTVAGVSLRAALPRLLDKELLVQDDTYRRFALAVPHWREYLQDRFDVDTKVGVHHV